MPVKRRNLSYNARFKRARMGMKTQAGYRRMLSRKLPARFGGPNVAKALPVFINRVNNLYRMIETKEITWKLESTTGTKYEFPHNNLLVWTQNPFQVSQGVADNMAAGNAPNRIGDQITVKGFGLTLFLENALARPKVFYRIMVVRCAKGDTPDRTTFFKGNCDNKMIDQVNTERYTIVAQKMFSIDASNTIGSTVSGTGVSGSGANGIATKVVKMWIPGRKFGRGGNLQYENNSYQLKFFDYKVVMLAYDWFGTPQDVNMVGLINCMYTKIYFKDA